ncbi:MAG: DNA mismatch repair protein MutS, partial [Phycisphaeraceae bacterium]|nr:DNA mismatch repair protein MutS [Phycisphaeraceae bacterium]
ASIDPVHEAGDAIQAAIVDEPPAVVRDGGLIRDGHDEDLDEMRSLARDGKQFIADLEAREREATGIASLKVRYNRVFGYFIEVSKANLDRVPEDYDRRQTLTNAERFITPELKELESRILSAEERATARDRQLFGELIDELSTHAQRISGTAEKVARLDVLSAFADRARRWGYCRPVMADEPGITIDDGRHPVLEELQRDPPFI